MTKKKLILLVLGLVAFGGLSAGMFQSGVVGASGGDDSGYYKVTITNVTNRQIFTPILVVTHKEGVNLFKLGDPASGPLAALAEGGNTVPLTTMLAGMSGVKDVVTAGPLLMPGQSRTIMVKAGKRLSLASMLIPTNDGFVALNGVKVGGKSKTFWVPAYDAGSELNDELCSSIPGPDCGGPGAPGIPGGGEGFVHIHRGIHGVGDLAPSTFDWNNPVARITVVKVDADDETTTTRAKSRRPVARALQGSGPHREAGREPGPPLYS